VGQWRIGILGPVELRGLADLGGAMERCLLAALAVHCGEAVSAESWWMRCGMTIRPGRIRGRAILIPG
jgi:hypothetical protein